jgi:hypothetical protein
MNEKPQASIIELIRKILSKTESNGCTPGEADAAVGDRSTLEAGYEAGKSLNLSRALAANGRKGIGGR